MGLISDIKQAAEMLKLQDVSGTESLSGQLTPKEGFEGLLKLSENPKSRFRIVGDARQLVIIPKPDFIPIFLWFVFIMAGVISAASDLNRDFIMIMMPVYFGAMFLFYRLGPTTYEITIDTFRKQILLQSNNPIGRFLKPKVEIDFEDFEKLSSRIIYSKMKDGLNTSFNKIHIHYKNKKQLLIYLGNGPYSFIDDELFILNFSALITKKGKSG